MSSTEKGAPAPLVCYTDFGGVQPIMTALSTKSGDSSKGGRSQTKATSREESRAKRRTSKSGETAAMKGPSKGGAKLRSKRRPSLDDGFLSNMVIDHALQV